MANVVQRFARLRGRGCEIALALVALWAFVFAWQAHYGFGPADEGLLWYVSQRTALGELAIRDWYAYEPGRYAWSAAWFGLLGSDGLLQQRIANLAFASIGFASVVAVMRAAGVQPALRIAAIALLCVMLGFPQHKLYEQGLALALVALAYDVLRRPGLARFMLLGVATGVAACIGKNSGVYFLGGALLAWSIAFLRNDLRGIPALRALLACGAGVVVGFSPMLWLLATDPAFRSAFIDTILLAPQWQLSLPIPWPWRLQWSGDLSDYQRHLRWLGVLCVVVPLAYAVPVVAWRRNRSTLRDLSLAATIAGVPYLHHAFDRADFGHVTQGVVPVAISVVALLALALHGRSMAAIVGTALLSIVATLAILGTWWPLQPRVAHDANPAAYATLRDRDSEIRVPVDFATLVGSTRAALARCAPRDGMLLVAPHSPGLYAWLRLRAPYWELYYLHKRSLAQQRAHVDAIAHARTALAIVDPVATFDGRSDLQLQATQPLLLAYLRAHYARVATSGTRETWALAGGCAVPPR